MKHRKEIYEREKMKKIKEVGQDIFQKSTVIRSENSCDRRLVGISQTKLSSVTESPRTRIRDCNRKSRRGAFEEKVGIITLSSPTPTSSPHSSPIRTVSIFQKNTSGQTVNSIQSSPVRSVYLSHKDSSRQTVDCPSLNPMHTVYKKGTAGNNHARTSGHYQQYKVQKRGDKQPLFGNVSYTENSNSHPIQVIGKQIDSLRDDSLYGQDPYNLNSQVYSEKFPLGNRSLYTSSHNYNQPAPYLPVDYQYFHDNLSRPIHYPYESYNDNTMYQPWLTSTYQASLYRSPWNLSLYQSNPIYNRYTPILPSFHDAQMNTCERRGYPDMPSYQTQNTAQHTCGFNTASIMGSSRGAFPYHLVGTNHAQANINHNMVPNAQVSVQPDTAVSIVTAMHVQNVSRETVSRQIEIIPLAPPPTPPDFLLNKTPHMIEESTLSKQSGVSLKTTQTTSLEEQSSRESVKSKPSSDHSNNTVSAFENQRHSQHYCNESLKRGDQTDSYQPRISEQQLTSIGENEKVQGSLNKAENVNISNVAIEKNDNKLAPSNIHKKQPFLTSRQQKACETNKQDSHKPFKKRLLETAYGSVSSQTSGQACKDRDMTKQIMIPLGRRSAQCMHKRSVRNQDNQNDFTQKRDGSAIKHLRSNSKCIKCHQKDNRNKSKGSGMFTTYVKKTNAKLPKSYSKKTVVVNEADSSTPDSINNSDKPNREGYLHKYKNKYTRSVEGIQKANYNHKKKHSEDTNSAQNSDVVDENKNVTVRIDKNLIELKPEPTQQKRLNRHVKADQSLKKKIKNSSINSKCLQTKEKKDRHLPPPRSKQFLKLLAKQKLKKDYEEKVEYMASKHMKHLLVKSKCLDPMIDTNSSALTNTANPLINTTSAYSGRAQMKYLKKRIMEKFEKEKKRKSLLMTNQLNRSSDKLLRKKMMSLTNEKQIMTNSSKICGKDKLLNTHVSDKVKNKRGLLGKHKSPPNCGKLAIRECSVVLENKPLKVKSTAATKKGDLLNHKRKNKTTTSSSIAKLSCDSSSLQNPCKPKSKRKRPEEHYVGGTTRETLVNGEEKEENSYEKTKKSSVETNVKRKNALVSRGKYVLSTPTTYKIRALNSSLVNKDKKLGNAKIRFLKACSIAKRLLNLRSKAGYSRKRKSNYKSSDCCERKYSSGCEIKNNVVNKCTNNSDFPLYSNTQDCSLYPDKITSTILHDKDKNSDNDTSRSLSDSTLSCEPDYQNVEISLQEPLVATEIPSSFGYQTAGETPINHCRQNCRKRLDFPLTWVNQNVNAYERHGYVKSNCIESMMHYPTQTPSTQSSLKVSPDLGNTKFPEFFREVLQKHSGIESCPDTLIGSMQTDIIEMYKKYVQAKAMISQTDQRPLQNVYPPILVSPSSISENYPGYSSFSYNEPAETYQQRETPFSDRFQLESSLAISSSAHIVPESRLEMTRALDTHDIMCTCTTAPKADDSGVYSEDSLADDKYTAVPLDDLNYMYSESLMPGDQNTIKHFVQPNSLVKTRNSGTIVNRDYLSPTGQSENLPKQSIGDELAYRNVFDDAVVDMIQKETLTFPDDEHGMLEALYDDSAIVPDILDGINREDLFKPIYEECRTSDSLSSECYKDVRTFDSQRHLHPSSSKPVTPFQPRIRSERRKRYQKRLPYTLPKVKSNKVGATEKELYKDAEEFLSNFDASQKRGCRTAFLDQKNKFRLNIFEYVEQTVERQREKDDKNTSSITETETAASASNTPETSGMKATDTKTSINDSKNTSATKTSSSDKKAYATSACITDNMKTSFSDTSVNKSEKAVINTKTDKINQCLGKKSHGDNKPPQIMNNLEMLVTKKRQKEMNEKSKPMSKHKKQKIDNNTDSVKPEKALSTKNYINSNNAPKEKNKYQKNKSSSNKDLTVKCEPIPLLRIKTENTGLTVVLSEKKRKKKENKSGHFRAVTKRLIEAGTLVPSTVKNCDKTSMPCSVCEKLFKRDWKLRKHFRNEHKDWCQTCTVKLPDMDAHLEHLAQGHDVQLFCVYCQKLFYTKKGFKGHRNSPIHLLQTELAKTKQMVLDNRRKESAAKEKSKDEAQTYKYPKTQISSKEAEHTVTALKINTNVGKEKGSKNEAIQKDKSEKTKEYCTKCKCSYAWFRAHLKTKKHRMSGTDKKKAEPVKMSKKSKGKALKKERPESLPEKNPVIELTNLQPATITQSPPSCNPVLLIKNIASTLSCTTLSQTGNHTNQTETNGNLSNVTEWVEIGENNDVCVIESLSSPDPANIEKLMSMNVDRYLGRKSKDKLDLYSDEPMEYADQVLRPDQFVVVVTSSGSELD